MLDSMIQMQLRAQEAKQETAASVWQTPEREEDEAPQTETFLERIERIRRQNRREERMEEQYRRDRQLLRKKRMEEYLKACYVRRRRQELLDKQAAQKKIAERETNQKRGAMLILARSSAGRLPVSAEIRKTPQPGAHLPAARKYGRST